MSRPATIGWVEGDRFVSARVSLKDVSLSGISALATFAIPEGSIAWVSLHDSHEGRWVKAVVVDVHRVRKLLTYRKSPTMIRMRFSAGCPYTFFRAAVHGKASAGGGASVHHGRGPETLARDPSRNPCATAPDRERSREFVVDRDRIHLS